MSTSGGAAFSRCLAVLLLSGAVETTVVTSACARAKDERPVFELGPEVLVSGDADGGALRVEPSAALRGRYALVAWNDSWGGRHGSESGTAVGWAVSDDGAHSFRFGGYVPAAREGEPPAGADSWLATDASGVFYLQVLTWSPSRHALRIFVMNPSDSLAWTEMAPAAVADLTVGEEALDKPALTVSPDGRLTVVYQRGRRIMLRRSPDGGRHWLPERLVSDSATARAHGPSVTSAGDRYVVCWYEQEAPGSAEELWCNRSNDGHRFGRPERLFRSERALPPPTGYRIAVGRFAPGANAWVAADPSTGRIYLAFAAGTAQASDILLWRLDRADTSWRGPDRVGHGPPAASKVFPTVAVAEGIPHVMYYDQRRDPGTGWTDVYLSSRTGDGHHDIRLNDEPTDWTLMPPDAEHAPIQRNAGDYITLAADGPRLLAVWTDGRLGQPRIFARTVEVIR